MQLLPVIAPVQLTVQILYADWEPKCGVLRNTWISTQMGVVQEKQVNVYWLGEIERKVYICTNF